jgi:DNA-binding response OmpR family regulator
MVLKKVLIVDDEANILATLRGMLLDEGFVVEVARDGEIALKKAAEFRPDVDHSTSGCRETTVWRF